MAHWRSLANRWQKGIESTQRPARTLCVSAYFINRKIIIVHFACRFRRCWIPSNRLSPLCRSSSYTLSHTHTHTHFASICACASRVSIHIESLTWCHLLLGTRADGGGNGNIECVYALENVWKTTIRERRQSTQKEPRAPEARWKARRKNENT